MTTEQKIIKNRVGLLELARQLGKGKHQATAADLLRGIWNHKRGTDRTRRRTKANCGYSQIR